MDGGGYIGRGYFKGRGYCLGVSPENSGLEDSASTVQIAGRLDEGKPGDRSNSEFFYFVGSLEKINWFSDGDGNLAFDLGYGEARRVSKGNGDYPSIKSQVEKLEESKRENASEVTRG